MNPETMNNYLRVGILTLHETINYGATMQLYALAQTIKKMGFEPVVLDHRCQAVFEREIPEKPRLFGYLRHLKMYKEAQANYRASMSRREKIAQFKRSNYPSFVDASSLETVSQHCDAVIVGSDQVWNTEIIGDDKAFFLSQIEDSSLLKISYAASFGDVDSIADIPASNLIDIGRFGHISVREKHTAKLLQEYLGRDVLGALDPTLLLNKEEWDKLTPERIIEEPYVFAYIVAEQHETLAFAVQLAQKNGCRVVALDLNSPSSSSEAITYMQDASPEEFLSLIKYASNIVTSSFHGFCFSLIFGKEVYYKSMRPNGGKNKRIMELAEGLHVGCHAIEDGFAESPMNYELIEKALQEKRNESIAFLSEALNG